MASRIHLWDLDLDLTVVIDTHLLHDPTNEDKDFAVRSVEESSSCDGCFDLLKRFEVHDLWSHICNSNVVEILDRLCVGRLDVVSLVHYQDHIINERRRDHWSLAGGE